MNVMKDSCQAHQALSVLITAKAFVLLKFYRQCVRWPQAAGILSLSLSAAVMEAGAGVTSVSSAHFLEPPNTRNSVHMDQDILQMEEILMNVRSCQTFVDMDNVSTLWAHSAAFVKLAIQLT